MNVDRLLGDRMGECHLSVVKHDLIRVVRPLGAILPIPDYWMTDRSKLRPDLMVAPCGKGDGNTRCVMCVL